MDRERRPHPHQTRPQQDPAARARRHLPRVRDPPDLSVHVGDEAHGHHSARFAVARHPVLFEGRRHRHAVDRPVQ